MANNASHQYHRLISRWPEMVGKRMSTYCVRVERSR